MMFDFNCWRTKRRLNKAFETGSLPKTLHDDAHLHRCGACRHRYNKLVMTQRALDSGDGPRTTENPTPAELQQLKSAILSQLPASTATHARQPRGVWVGIGGLSAVSAMAVVAFVIWSRPPATSEFAARGGADVGKPALYTGVGIRLFCVGPADAIKEVRSNDTCQITQRLRLALTNKSALTQLVVFGIDRNRKVYHYVQSAMPQGAVDQPIGESIVLADNHTVGPLRIVALFSAAKIQSSAIEQWAGRFTGIGMPLSDAASSHSALHAIGAQASRDVMIRLVP